MIDPIDFLLYIGQLKQTVRSGWRNHGVTNPESVADHMYRMSIMSFLLPSININEMKINNNHVMKMTLIHDLAECIVGDITPYDGYTKSEKLKLETERMHKIELKPPLLGVNKKVQIDETLFTRRKYNVGRSTREQCVFGGIDTTPEWFIFRDAMETIVKTVPSEVGNEIMELWNEYNDQKTQESQIAKDFDRFDMILQAYEYERNQNKAGHLQDFFDSTHDKFSSELVRNWAKELYKRREQLLVTGKIAE